MTAAAFFKHGGAIQERVIRIGSCEGASVSLSGKAKTPFSFGEKGV
jgi:hypothetical protein